MTTDKSLTGLFFGSFNPVHIGHMAIAEYMIENTSMQSLWFVVSPQNPLKKKQSLLPERERLYMVQKAINDDKRFKTCDIEFGLTKPSYTINTLSYLSEKYPDRKFALIVGGDNLQNFHKWKNHEQILLNYHLFVYKRPGIIIDQLNAHPHVHIVDAPQMEISSSFIRKSIAEGKSISRYLPLGLAKYIDEMNYYR